MDADEGAVPGEMNDNIDGIIAADIGDEFQADAFVVGVNYFPTPAVRMSLNYVDYQVDNIDTNAQIDGEDVQDDGKAIMGRLQYVF